MARIQDTERADVDLHSFDDTATAAGDREATKDENNLPISDPNTSEVEQLRPMAHAATKTDAFGVTDDGEVLHDVSTGIILPPFPSADAVERKPLSAEQILDMNPDLTNEQLKDRFRFCQEKIDCCREMLESIIAITSEMNDMIEHYNRFVSPLLSMQKVPTDSQSEPFALECLGLLRQMEDLEDLSLYDLFFLHVTYEKIARSSHTSFENDHIFNCKFYDV